MVTIIEILGVEEKRKDNKIYYLTHAIVEDGDELVGFGKFEVGEKVQRYFHYGRGQMRRPDDPKTWQPEDN